jgi:hypothetical protein
MLYDYLLTIHKSIPVEGDEDFGLEIDVRVKAPSKEEAKIIAIDQLDNAYGGDSLFEVVSVLEKQ